MVGFFQKLDCSFQLPTSIVVKAHNMHAMNIVITTRFRGIKYVAFLSMTKSETLSQRTWKIIFICFVECFPLMQDGNNE